MQTDAVQLRISCSNLVVVGKPGILYGAKYNLRLSVSDTVSAVTVSESVRDPNLVLFRAQTTATRSLSFGDVSYCHATAKLAVKKISVAKL